MIESLKDKVAIVTGASRGIGLSIAESLAQAGVHLALVSTKIEDVTRIGEDLSGRFGVRFLPLQVDVRNHQAVTEAVEQVQMELGEPDFLINNAGITRDSLLIKMKPEDWDEVIATNLKGPFSFTKAVAKAMMKRRQGAIVNITSVVGLMGNPGQANYSAAKAGMIGFTKTLAKELAPRGIRVNAIAPGFIQSSMTDKIPDRLKDELLARIPLGFFGEAGHVADSVSFLLSDKASYITGSVLQVDGGLNM